MEGTGRGERHSGQIQVKCDAHAGNFVTSVLHDQMRKVLLALCSSDSIIIVYKAKKLFSSSIHLLIIVLIGDARLMTGQ